MVYLCIYVVIANTRAGLFFLSRRVNIPLWPILYYIDKEAKQQEAERGSKRQQEAVARNDLYS
jgi:hypothetical protein